jgi:hypothetical protein
MIRVGDTESQTVIDLADGDPAKGAGFGVGSPLAIASAWRGTARWWLGRPGWRQDLHDAVAMARRSNPETLAGGPATYGCANVPSSSSRSATRGPPGKRPPAATAMLPLG